MKKLVLILGLLTLISCEKEIDFEIPNPGTKIVIDSRLVSGENASALLSTSVYSMSNEIPRTNGNMKAVLLKDGVFQDSLLPVYSNNIEEWIYQSNNHIIQAQSNYSIKAQFNQLPEASASNYTPNEVEASISKVERTIININGQTYSLPTNFTFNLADEANSEDYYRISLSQRNGTPPVFFSSTNPVLTDFYNNFDFEGDGGKTFFYYAYLSDKDLSTISSSFDIVIEEPPINDLYLCVEHITRDYFEHERTKALALFGGDGFSEPVQVFSNVKNGYGIVAASTPTFTKVE